MKLIDLNMILTLVRGVKDTKWNAEIVKAFLLGITAGIYLIYWILVYIEKRTDYAIEENLDVVPRK